MKTVFVKILSGLKNICQSSWHNVLVSCPRQLLSICPILSCSREQQLIKGEDDVKIFDEMYITEPFWWEIIIEISKLNSLIGNPLLK